MENKAKYFWVGIFVFGIFFASLFVLIWLNGFSSKQNFTYYQIFIKESVSGLGLKALRLLASKNLPYRNLLAYLRYLLQT